MRLTKMTYGYEIYFSVCVATCMDSFPGNVRLIRIHKGTFYFGFILGGHHISLLQSQITHHKLHVASIKLTAPKMYFRSTVVMHNS